MVCGTKTVKISYIVFNVILALLGIAAIVWVAINPDEIAEDSAIAIYIAGSLLVLFASLGSFGAIRESICLLATCGVFLFILAVLQITFTLLDHSKAKHSNAIETVDYFWDINKMDDLQSKYVCCGKTGAQDYIQLSKPVPVSCYKNVDGSAVEIQSLKTIGCIIQLQEHYDMQSVKFAIVSWLLIGFEILGFLLAVFLVINFRNKQRRMHF